MSSSVNACAVFLCTLSLASVASAQRTGSVAADRARLKEITGDTSSAPIFQPAWVRLVQPDVRLAWNSDIPYSLNDGAMWAGRGANVSASVGVESSVRTWRGTLLRVRIAPAIHFSQNLPFPIMAGTTPGRSTYSSPFHGNESSMDLPLRFGDQPLRRLDLGRSELEASWSRVAVRFTASNDWWGPALRNALVMSDNAAGIPRVEVASVKPMHTPIGAVEWKAIAGTLTPSLFFDNLGAQRGISGAVITLRPKFDTTLTIGIERVVYVPAWPISALGHLMDFAFRWEPLIRPSDTLLATPRVESSDQITALTVRWVFPSSGLEVYGEWARADLPRSLAELMLAPHYSGAYTVGLQWAQTRQSGALLRLQSEFTYLEQNNVLGNRNFTEFYSGHSQAAGYTQRGQVIGAAIGPGGSSQWVAIDHIAKTWQLGLFAGRVRWENDAFNRVFVPNFFRHDVSSLRGIRGAYRTPLTDISVDVTWAYRYNYLFQNGFANPGQYGSVDMRNLTMSLSATPR